MDVDNGVLIGVAMIVIGFTVVGLCMPQIVDLLLRRQRLTDEQQKHEQRMAEIYQREVDYRQHGIVDIAATHNDIDYLWTRLRLLEREIAPHPAHPLPAPTGEDGGA